MNTVVWSSAGGGAFWENNSDDIIVVSWWIYFEFDFRLQIFVKNPKSLSVIVEGI